ncbi:sodium:proton antiporter [Rhodocytophaga aerolata]|uniref:Sodium:proton antiporter n=1 Tax=Rhodocytophaga aerolata TaxID=455078 RepID=A0ABT8RCQ4_9BACT|nr:sodium:proton antiporter [Rhodocytophaga aerolata]MDO1449886.1 sodium:proton antiporter [Rhodocytophaga aerolata]
MSILDIICILISLSVAFIYLNNRYLKLPATIGLTILALLTSFMLILTGKFVPAVTRQAQAIVVEFNFSQALLNFMLSFLLFAGAISVNLRSLIRERWSILTLATVSTLLSTVITGVLLYYLLQLFTIPLDFIYCLLFGALISPTDPVAVLSMVKKLGISRRLQVRISGESLFNDGIGVVLFLCVASIASAGVENFSPLTALTLFSKDVLGGILLGLLLGYIGYQALSAVENEYFEIEILITLSMVMGGTRLAQLLHVSVPLTMVVMGLFVSYEGRRENTPLLANLFVSKFWHLLDEILNAILFLLVGFKLLIIEIRPDYLLAGVVAVLVVLISRYIGVIIPIYAFNFKRSFSHRTITILTWGGLRGAISIALALSLPETAQKEFIIAITYMVVLFSILVQGLTIGKLLEKKEEPEVEAKT